MSIRYQIIEKKKQGARAEGDEKAGFAPPRFPASTARLDEKNP